MTFWKSLIQSECTKVWISSLCVCSWILEIVRKCQKNTSWLHTWFSCFKLPISWPVGLTDVSETQQLVEAVSLWQIVDRMINGLDCWVVAKVICKTAQASENCLLLARLPGWDCVTVTNCWQDDQWICKGHPQNCPIIRKLSLAGPESNNVSQWNLPLWSLLTLPAKVMTVGARSISCSLFSSVGSAFGAGNCCKSFACWLSSVVTVLQVSNVEIVRWVIDCMNTKFFNKAFKSCTWDLNNWIRIGGGLAASHSHPKVCVNECISQWIERWHDQRVVVDSGHATDVPPQTTPLTFSRHNSYETSPEWKNSSSLRYEHCNDIA